MIQVPVEAIPNQTFGVRLDNERYSLTLKAIDDNVAVTIVRDGVTLVSNQRAVAGSPLLPYTYLESGNFIFVTENDEAPSWRLFNATQFLVYLTASEVAT